MDEKLVSEVAQAIRSGVTLLILPGGNNLSEAYESQHQVTKILSPDGIDGIKAGVTAEGVQKYLDLEHALIGSLYKGSKCSSGESLPHVEGRLIETEVALRLDADGKPLSIAPALEIVAVRFASSDQMNASNLVVCNLGADLFVVGDFVPWDPAYNNLPIRLYHDGDLANETSVDASLKGPEEGAKWICDEARLRGFTWTEDTVFMMGSCGKVAPAERGRYRGDYGALGQVEIEIA